MTARNLWILAAASVCLAAVVPDDASLLPEGAGKELVAQACIDCHDSATFRKKRFTEDQWVDKVADMVDRGAKANEQQQAILVAYLAKNFGKGSKVQMNSAPLSEIQVVLGFSAADAQSVVTYRGVHGIYREWRDLLKVPGIDAAKVEAKQDQMAF